MLLDVLKSFVYHLCFFYSKINNTLYNKCPFLESSAKESRAQMLETTTVKLLFKAATAVLAIANILKSSLGPQGLDKMIVSDIGDITITNDGATILKQLEVEHPAARILVELANIQDKEVGDGTTSVVLIAAELLKVRII
jgi:chaperonin GroEL (HSP60 family)